MNRLLPVIKEFHKKIDYAKGGKCKSKVASAKNCRDCCRLRYFNKQTVAYDCEQMRHIYVVSYVPVHIQEVYQALSSITADTRADLPLNAPDLRVLSIGGGPGSDIAAFRKFLSDSRGETSPATKVRIDRLDRVKEWDGIARRVFDVFEAQNSVFDHHKICSDFAKTGMRLKNTYNIILISYVISELKGNDTPIFCANLKSCLGKRALIIFNDRNEGHIVATIRNLATALDFETLCDGNSQEYWVGLGFPDEIKVAAEPKLKTSSIRFVLRARK